MRHINGTCEIFQNNKVCKLSDNYEMGILVRSVICISMYDMNDMFLKNVFIFKSIGFKIWKKKSMS